MFPPQPQHLVPNSRNLPVSLVRNMAGTKIDGERNHENERESREGESYDHSQSPWSPSNQPPPLPSFGSTSTAAMSHTQLPPIQTDNSHSRSPSNPNANVNNGFTFAWPSRGSSNLNKANPSTSVDMNGGSDQQPVTPTAGALLSGIYLPPMDTSAPINVRKDSGHGLKLPSISSMFGSISPAEERDDEGGRKLNNSVSYNGNSRGSTASASGRDRESFSAGGRELASARSFTSDRSNRSILSPDEGSSITSPLERLGRLRLNSLPPPILSGDSHVDGQTLSSTKIFGPSLGLIIEPIPSLTSDPTPSGVLPPILSRSENLSPTSPNRGSTRLPSISSLSTYPTSLDYPSNKREREPEGVGSSSGGGGGKRDSIASIGASGSTWSHGSSNFSGSGASSLFLHNSDNTSSSGGRNYDYSRNRNSTSTTASTHFEYDAPPSTGHLSAPNSAPSTGTSGDTCGTGTPGGGGYRNHGGGGYSKGRRRNGSDSSRTSFGSEVLADWEGLGLTEGGGGETDGGERKEEERERMDVTH